MEKPDFENDLKIDKYALDEEWEKQAALFMSYCEAYAEAVYDRDRIKEQLEIERAKVGQEIQDDPESFGLAKVTIDALNKTINKDQRIIDKQQELHEANKNVNLLSGGKEAMNHKKKAIEMLVELLIQGYFAEPKVKKEAKEQSSKKKSEEIRESLEDNKRLKNRRRNRNED